MKDTTAAALAEHLAKVATAHRRSENARHALLLLLRKGAPLPELHAAETAFNVASSGLHVRVESMLVSYGILMELEAEAEQVMADRSWLTQAVA